MATRTLQRNTTDADGNPVVETYKEYHRNKWIAAVLGFFFGLFTLLYTREYKLFFITWTVVIVVGLILSGDEYSSVGGLLVSLILAIRYAVMSKENFFKLVNRQQ